MEILELAENGTPVIVEWKNKGNHKCTSVGKFVITDDGICFQPHGCGNVPIEKITVSNVKKLKNKRKLAKESLFS